jgi:hypothetical protein
MICSAGLLIGRCILRVPKLDAVRFYIEPFVFRVYQCGRRSTKGMRSYFAAVLIGGLQGIESESKLQHKAKDLETAKIRCSSRNK